MLKQIGSNNLMQISDILWMIWMLTVTTFHQHFSLRISPIWYCQKSQVKVDHFEKFWTERDL